VVELLIPANRFRGSNASRRLLLAIMAAGVCAAANLSAKTLAFAITDWRPSVYGTPYYDECPEGMAIGNDEIWWKSLSPRDRDKYTDGGLIEPVDPPRAVPAMKRGPQGEDVCWSPELVQDPPLRTVKGKISYGMNLDGTDDGRATANTCGHEKFTSPDGKERVDNQMYRVIGCISGWRDGNYAVEHQNRERRDSSKGAILIEVTGVKTGVNDPDVEVAYYGTDTVFSKDGASRILPYASYRISPTPLYGARAHGKVVDGVLITDPVDAELPLFGHNYIGDMDIRGLRLRMKLDQGKPDGPYTGMLAGYYDLDSWRDWLGRTSFLVVAGQWSCPAVIEASKRLADGYPDPKTGNCTALSTAMDFQAEPAFVIHPSKAQEKISEIPQPDKTAGAPEKSVQVIASQRVR
jgi:hypothetical protein